jgi:hypothetical protein
MRAVFLSAADDTRQMHHTIIMMIKLISSVPDCSAVELCSACLLVLLLFFLAA